MAKVSETELKGLLEKCSNWGRWGKDDERGALNYINDRKRAAAAKLVHSGEAVSMSLPLATLPAPDNPMPVMHLVQQCGHDSMDVLPLPHSADYFAIAPHGLANTHLDALCHVFHNGKMYNGYSAAEVGSRGAKKCAIDVAASTFSLPANRQHAPAQRDFTRHREVVTHRQLDSERDQRDRCVSTKGNSEGLSQQSL
jgi:hypothetical protein